MLPEETGYQLHTEETPFCFDSTCPCREDQDAIGQLEQHRQDGLVSNEDVTRIYNGQTI